MKNAIGSELIKLFHTEQHLNLLENNYSACVKDGKKIDDLGLDKAVDLGIRSSTIEHIGNFNALKKEDLEDYYLNFVTTCVVKIEKIIEILKNKEAFIERIRALTKKAIFKLIDSQLLNHQKQELTAEHYFPGGKYTVFFEIELNTDTKKIIIHNVSAGDEDAIDEDLTNNYIELIGLEF